MDAEEFRRQGRAVIDWIADYWERLDDLPVLAQVEPGGTRASMGPVIGEEGESFDAVLADLDRVVLPGITHWQHPRFFAYFPANSSPAAILGDLISSGIGAQGMLWATSPALTEVEQEVLDAFADELGLPAHFRSDGTGGGVIQDTASTATFTALLAALARAGDGEVRREGIRPGRWRVYGSDQAHSSLNKAVVMAGLGEESLRLVPVLADQRMDVAALERMVAEDVAAGRQPVLVQAACGTTSTGAFDDIGAIVDVAGAHGAWVHVDAAWAGVAAVAPELREHLAGVDRADSFVTNPHKWLLTTFDCSTFWVRDRAPLLAALSLLPEYLRNPASESGAVVDFRDWHPQLGRRFRAMKLWTVLRTYGRDGLRAHVREGVELARHLEELVAADERFELLVPRSLSLVVVAHRDGDGATMALMESVNASGVAYLSHTRVEGRAAIRVAVGSWRTTLADVDRLWSEIAAGADRVTA